ncbi:Tat binding protein 1-interacting protein-domain-containing protein [Phascolomyces articulosus]|uniref:Tat binding protein 1-interacting protein-domain-containing protein n=1 Tax=Phascolomyces articulosus TaxID=60185 RepID=A0AAD5K4B9_9FUNG|nr:Tat binding protein 1-interacting protein-domain-containing protein [Phascolomyces articulosus]
MLADIFNNLQGKYPKANVVKVLDRLTSQDMIYSKTYGKTNIYSVKQVKKKRNQEEFNALDKQLEELSQQEKTLHEEMKWMEKELKLMRQEPQLEDAKMWVPQLLEKNSTLQARIDILKTDAVLLSDDEKTKINANYDQMRKAWRTRRKTGKEIYNAIAEHIPGKPYEIKAKLGIEDDPIPYEQDLLSIVLAKST